MLAVHRLDHRVRRLEQGDGDVVVLFDRLPRRQTFGHLERRRHRRRLTLGLVVGVNREGGFRTGQSRIEIIRKGAVRSELNVTCHNGN